MDVDIIRNTLGYVYFLQIDNSDGYIKVGFTRDLGNRICSFRVDSPYKFKTISIYETTGHLNVCHPNYSVKNIEKDIHKMFREDRIIGEWFRPSKKLLDFIRKECSDITSLCQLAPYKKKYMVREDEFNLPINTDKTDYNLEGCVYFTQVHNTDGYIKIGFSTNPEQRRKDLQIGLPYPLDIKSVFLHQPKRTEYLLHTLFQAYHIRGEWFRPEDELIACMLGLNDFSFDFAACRKRLLTAFGDVFHEYYR